MTTKLIKRLAVCLVGSCAIAAVFMIAMPGSATASCPYNGSYVDCLQDGQRVDWCKTHVLNCADDIDTGSDADCTWLSDAPQEGCEDQGTYIRVGLPLDITLGAAKTCPYDSYGECLLDGQRVDWCKQHVLNCQEEPALYSILLPFTARVCLPGSCWPCVEGQGTITYNGTPEIIEDQFCLHVHSFEYSGDYESIVEKELIEELNQPNPLCNNDTWCICAPLECVQDLIEE
jgi:hypothetical protein